MKASANVAWAVENDGILVVRGESGEAWRLPYPDAAVWDLAVARAYPPNRVVEMVGAIANLDEGEARELLEELRAQWTGAGLLQPAQSAAPRPRAHASVWGPTKVGPGPIEEAPGRWRVP